MKSSPVNYWLNFNLSRFALFKECFKQRCFFCHSPCDDPSLPLLCSGCFSDLPWLTHFCQQCAEPLPAINLANQKPSAAKTCGRCLKKPPAFERTLCPLRYEFPINPLVSQLKDHARHDVLQLASFLFTSRWQDVINQDPPECLVPVPLHSKRLYQRSYNQSLEWARYLSKTLDIPLNHNAVKRTLATPDQKQLGAKTRRRNLKNAFEVNDLFKAKHVAIVDDVMTTGATADTLAAALKRAGVQRVEVWCLGRTPFKSL